MDIMNFERFKTIIKVIQDFDNQREKIDKFFESEIMENSFCNITIGNNIQSTLINMLADEFDCWFQIKDSVKLTYWWKNRNNYGMSNEIEWWLYESSSPKIITMQDKDWDVTSIESFYDYLMYCYYDKKVNNRENVYSNEEVQELSEDDRIDIIKGIFSI